MVHENIPGRQDLLASMARIEGLVHRSPLMRSSFLDDLLSSSLIFKCENFQKIGAFKIRGATNAMRSMPKGEIEKGVCTHSSGNHAQAVAFAARALGVPAHIVMPSTAPAVKVAAVKGYGAHVYMCEPTLAARESNAAKVMEETGASFLHPYDDARVVAGQATAAMEMFGDVEEPFDYLLCPVGGGGLLGGSALAAHYFSPATKVIACEPDAADDAFRSFKDGKHYPSENPNTIADGLLTSVGKLNFEIMQKHVFDVITCSEASIVEAMRMIWERMKIIIEPSSAVPLACLLERKLDVAGKKVGIILSGGNVDLGKLPF